MSFIYHYTKNAVTRQLLPVVPKNKDPWPAIYSVRKGESGV
jgi:hypothetical protein